MPGSNEKNSLVVNYEKPVAEAINKVKQDSAKKEIEQSMEHEIERHQRNETFSAVTLEPNTVDNLKSGAVK